jgi:biotin synthesis protein BioG
MAEPGFMEAVSRYAHVTVIAWSFGVWVAQHVELPPVERAIALNGTLHPVHDTLGIPSGVFQATLSSYSDESRNRFNRRMCGSSEAFALFTTLSPDRETVEQKEELERLSEHFQRQDLPAAPRWKYNHAIIGGRDLVFPAQQQYSAWKGVPQTVIADMAHFPFFHFSTLQELLACIRK